jgi:hypothetical protein
MNNEKFDTIIKDYTSQGITTPDNVLCLPPNIALKFIDDITRYGGFIRAVLGWFYVQEDHTTVTPDITVFIDVGDILREQGLPKSASARIAQEFILHRLPPNTDLISTAYFFEQQT